MKDEQRLVQQAQLGDDLAFNLLIDSYIPIVHNFILHLSKDSIVSEDLTQETLFKAWRHLSKFDNTKKFRPWLLTIAHRSTLDYWRKRKIINFSELVNTEDKEFLDKILVSEEQNPEEFCQNQEDIKAVQTIIAQLSLIEQEIIFLHNNEELTFDEIGQLQNKPLNTVKSIYRRALQKIKQKLNK